MSEKEEVGVIGAGSFGTAITRLLWINQPVLIYTRNKNTYEQIAHKRTHFGLDIPDHVSATMDPSELTDRCRVIFPVVGSKNFRDMVLDFRSYLAPRHLVIHGTKGFHVTSSEEHPERLSRHEVLTMSEIILQESDVLRVGCLSGPNLAKEIMADQPAATLIASRYHEVITAGQKALSSDQFFVFGSHDIKAAEIAGALKNIFAIGSGVLGGLGIGKNAQSMLITRGLHEMIHFGKTMGAEPSAFMGTAGIGDLVATATSTLSRNYSFGEKIGRGEKKDDILKNSSEIYEGVRTLETVYLLNKQYKIQAPVTSLLYNIIYNNYDVKKGIARLMRFQGADDVEF